MTFHDIVDLCPGALATSPVFTLQPPAHTDNFPAISFPVMRSKFSSVYQGQLAAITDPDVVVHVELLVDSEQSSLQLVVISP